jgi:hypothetical protein
MLLICLMVATLIAVVLAPFMLVIRERFERKTVWEGIVHVYALEGLHLQVRLDIHRTPRTWLFRPRRLPSKSRCEQQRSRNRGLVLTAARDRTSGRYRLRSAEAPFRALPSG